MFQGKIKAALDMLSQKVKGKILHLDEASGGQKSVRDVHGLLFDSPG